MKRHAITFSLAMLGFAGSLNWGQTSPAPTPAPAARPPAALQIPDSPPEPVMVGSIEVRNALIQNALSGSGRVEQFNVNDVAVDSLLRFISMQWKVDIVLNGPALKKAEVKPNELSISLRGRSLEEMLLVTTSLLRPTTGFVGYKVDQGKIVIGPQAEPMAVDGAVEKKRNAGVVEALKAKIKVDGDLARQYKEGIPVGNFWHLLELQSKVDIVADWVELDKAGLSRSSVVKLAETERTVEEWLQDTFAAAAALPGVKEPLGYKIEYGVVRITTKAAAEAKVVAATRP